MFNKKINKTIVHYNDGKDYTVRNVIDTAVDYSNDTLCVAYHDKGSTVQRDIPTDDLLYVEYYDGMGDLHLFNFTNIPLKPVFKDRQYAKVMQTIVNDEGKTLGQLIKEVTDALTLGSDRSEYVHPVSEDELPEHTNAINVDEMAGGYMDVREFQGSIKDQVKPANNTDSKNW